MDLAYGRERWKARWIEHAGIRFEACNFQEAYGRQAYATLMCSRLSFPSVRIRIEILTVQRLS